MKKWLVPLVLVLIASFLLSACTPSSVPSTTQAPATSAPAPASSQPTTSKPAASNTPSAPVPTTAPAASAPVKGGIMKFAMTRPPIAFGYPPKIVGPDNHYARPFFERLLLQDNTGAYKGELATSYDIAADGKSITFKLRQGVQFNDGTPFNAAAVKWNFDGLIPPKSNVLAGVTSVDAVDDYTLKLNIPAFNNLLLYSLAVDMRTCIVSPTAVQKNGLDWAATHPVGTGPYLL
jgi:peptide/nickel transport system substrate-binding protein